MAVTLTVRKHEYPVLITMGQSESSGINNNDEFRIEVWVPEFKNALLYFGRASKVATGATVKFKAVFPLQTSILAGIRVRNLRTGTSWLITNYEIKDVVDGSLGTRLIKPYSVDFDGIDFGYCATTYDESTSIDMRDKIRTGIFDITEPSKYFIGMYMNGVFLTKIGKMSPSPSVNIYKDDAQNLLRYDVNIGSRNLNLKVKTGDYSYETILSGQYTYSDVLPFYANGIISVKTQVENIWGYVEWSGTANIPTNDEIVINLYKYDGETLNVKKELKGLLALTGKIRNSFNISEPFIEIKYSIVPHFNYCFIPSLGRFYYINSIESIGKEIWSLGLIVDVLMSWKDDILKQPAFVSRNENKYNDLLLDLKVPAELDYSFDFVVSDGFAIPSDTGGVSVDSFDLSYLVITLSKVDQTGLNTPLRSPNITKSSTVYALDRENYNKFTEQVLEPTFWQEFADAFQNHSDFIVGCYLCPMNIQALSKVFEGKTFGILGIEDDELYVGDKPIKADCTLVTALSRLKMYTELPQMDCSKFYHREGFSRYSLYLPYYGFVEVSPYAVYSGFMKYIVYDIDITTGDCIIYTSASPPSIDDPNSPSIYSWNTNIFTQLPLGRTDAAERHRNNMLLGLTLARDVAETTATAGLTMLKGSKSLTKKTKQLSAKGKRMIQGALEKGITEGSGDIFDTLIGVVSNMTPHGSTGGIPENILKLRDLPYVFLYRYTPSFYYPSNYGHLFGKPLQEYVENLGSLKGYTEVSQVHLLGYSNATLEEREEIEELLLSGIIL